MRRLLFTFAAVLCLSPLFSQNAGQLSLVFSSEKQNAMASKIPSLLMDAYRNGDIAAYYPQSPGERIPYTQFIQRYGGSAKAQQVLAGNPDWFCVPSELPRIDNAKRACLSMKFELGEKLVVNQVTMQNELQQIFVRLVYSETCDPRGFETYGPLFRVSDIEKLKQKQYKLINPQNQAVTYNIIDVLRLKLFSAVPRKG